MTLATLEGTVVDGEGATLPGANVKVTNMETGYVYSSLTGADGSYIISDIQPGRYECKVNLYGYRTQMRRGITIAVGAKLKIDNSLRPEAMEQQVMVVAEALDSSNYFVNHAKYKGEDPPKDEWERPPHLAAQELQHEVIAINVEVPVRVFRGNTFVDNLTINDFEVYEDGKLQEIVAVYLVKKALIEREEVPEEKGKKAEKFTPKVTRNFVLLFEVVDYLPKIKDALDYFCKNVIMRGDTLKVVTALKAYNIKEEYMEKLPKEKFAELLNEKVRIDTIKGNAEFKSLIREVLDPLTPPDLRMDFYRRLRDYIQFDEQKLLEFAEYMRSLEGQKHIFLFFQKQGIPISKNMDFFTRAELMKDVTFDENKIREALADSSISIHFLYITKEEGSATGITEMQSRSEGYELLDQSAQIFGAFKKMAQVTGGVAESSTNISFSMKKAVQASENYYLLYYRPANYITDGKFKKIQVKVKNKNYRIICRSGYFAD